VIAIKISVVWASAMPTFLTAWRFLDWDAPAVSTFDSILEMLQLAVAADAEER